MALTISNNGAVQAASYHLGKAQQGFDISIRRLSSGKKILGPNDDPGTLSVAMKVKASINRLTGAQNNIRNAIGFLEVQDGLLETAGRIVMRMSELKGYASQDPLKSDSDIASYNNEFKDLQVQLYQISQMDFNGASLFARYATDMQNPGETDNSFEAIFGAENQDTRFDHTLDIYTSSEGSEGTKVSIHKSMLLSALTMKMNTAGVTIGEEWDEDLDNDSAVLGNGTADKVVTLAVNPEDGELLDLSQVSAGVFEKAIENVVFLRAQTGGGLSRLSFAAESMAVQESNMRSALGRIEDVDIAAEAANLAKYSILMQASAAMVAQANSTSQVALMLLQN